METQPNEEGLTCSSCGFESSSTDIEYCPCCGETMTLDEQDFGEEIKELVF